MNRFERAAILTELADRLQGHGSWTGETHIQKATYVMEELLGVDLELEFILYRHGPFSFDLRDELTSIRADGLLEQVPHDPYGPTLRPTTSSVRLRDEQSGLIDANRLEIEFVADQLGGKGIAELERLSTALYVRRQNAGLTNAEAAAELRRLKPHITPELAATAVADMDVIADAARSIRTIAGANLNQESGTF